MTLCETYHIVEQLTAAIGLKGPEIRLLERDILLLTETAVVEEPDLVEEGDDDRGVLSSGVGVLVVE